MVSKSDGRWSLIGKDVLDGSVMWLLRRLYQPWRDASLNNGRNVGRHAATIDRPICIILQYMEVLMTTERNGE